MSHYNIFEVTDVSTWLAGVSLTAGIVVGYNRTNVNVFETDGQAELIIDIMEPAQTVTVETSFFLLVNSQDETASGLQWSHFMYP